MAAGVSRSARNGSGGPLYWCSRSGSGGPIRVRTVSRLFIGSYRKVTGGVWVRQTIGGISAPSRLGRRWSWARGPSTPPPPPPSPPTSGPTRTGTTTFTTRPTTTAQPGRGGLIRGFRRPPSPPTSPCLGDRRAPRGPRSRRQPPSTATFTTTTTTALWHARSKSSRCPWCRGPVAKRSLRTFGTCGYEAATRLRYRRRVRPIRC